MDLIIRKVEVKDKERVREFFAKQIRNTFIENKIYDEEDGIRSEIECKVDLLQKAISNKYPNEKLFIATLDDNIVGVGGHTKPNDIILDCDKDANIVVGSLYVDKDFRNNGIASSLINVISDELRRMKATHYFLDSGYKIAQNIWQRKFGVPTYTLKNYWGIDCHHMVWKVELANKEN